MRAPSRIRRIVFAAALAATALAPARAGAAEVSVAAVNGTFANGAGGWTATSSCAPLCSVTNALDPGPGASTPGSASVVYTTLAGLLGGLAAGTSTWASPSFTWNDATPDSVALTVARKAAIGGLLAVGGSAQARVQLDDLTAGTTTTIVSEGISTADASFVTHSLPFNPSLLKPAHSYRLLLTTNLSAAALLSGIRVAYDDVTLTATLGTSDSGGPGGTGGTGGPGGTGGTSPGPPGSGGGSPAALRLLAPRTVRFTRGRAVTVRVRASRAGRAVGLLVVTARIGKTTRRLSTDRTGIASMRLAPSGNAPIRITFRAGAAVTTTWVRPR